MEKSKLVELGVSEEVAVRVAEFSKNEIKIEISKGEKAGFGKALGEIDNVFSELGIEKKEGKTSDFIKNTISGLNEKITEFEKNKGEVSKSQEDFNLKISELNKLHKKNLELKDMEILTVKANSEKEIIKSSLLSFKSKLKIEDEYKDIVLDNAVNSILASAKRSKEGKIYYIDSENNIINNSETLLPKTSLEMLMQNKAFAKATADEKQDNFGDTTITTTTAPKFQNKTEAVKFYKEKGFSISESYKKAEGIFKD